MSARGCKNWTRGTNDKGYPVVRIGSEIHYARRVLWAVLRDTIKHGNVLHSMCENKLCMNLDHFVEVTRADAVRLSANQKKQT